MKTLFTITFIVSASMNLFAQRNHIKQSTPFEHAIMALQTDSTILFMNSFSEKIIDQNYDKEEWSTRLIEGKKKFEKRFGTYHQSDFTYKFKKKESMLVVYFKGEEHISLWIVKEKGVWKLNER